MVDSAIPVAPDELVHVMRGDVPQRRPSRLFLMRRAHGPQLSDAETWCTWGAVSALVNGQACAYMQHGRDTIEAGQASENRAVEKLGSEPSAQVTVAQDFSV